MNDDKYLLFLFISRSAVLFVVAENEMNIYDIADHVYAIREINPSIKVIFRDLNFLGEHANLSNDRRLMV